jgi:hypothetical protein
MADGGKLMKSMFTFCVLITLASLPRAALATGFATVINDPPTPVASFANILADTQLNVFNGGTVGDGVNLAVGAGAGNVELNVYGGSVGQELLLGSLAKVNVFGGSIGRRIGTSNGTVVNISGGSIADGFGARGAVNMTGGSIGDTFTAFSGSLINISGGTIGQTFTTNAVFSPAIVNISGGSIGSFTANPISKVNISGGELRGIFNIFADSEANISGGTFTNNFHAFERSAVNFIGTQFSLNGVPITGMPLGQKHIVGDREATLSGILADGSPFSFYLSTVFPPSDVELYFSTTATISVTEIPEPHALLVPTIALVPALLQRNRHVPKS